MDLETNDTNDQAIDVDDVSETVQDLSLSNTAEMGNEDNVEIETSPRDDKDDGFQDEKVLENTPTPEPEKDDQQNDEGIEEDDKDESESRKDDTYSDSLIDNVESFTSIDESKTSATALVETTPTSQSLEAQRSSVSPSSAGGGSGRTSMNKKGKRKSNDFKPTVVKPFSFTLDKRVEDRHKYNEKMQKMQKAQQERERLEKERQDREDDEKWKIERKKTIPKANPIRHYKPITVTPSKKPLTVPDAPKLRLENRNRNKVADKYDSSPPQGSGSNKVKHVL